MSLFRINKIKIKQMKKEQQEEPQGGFLSIITFVISVAVIIYALKIVLI